MDPRREAEIMEYAQREQEKKDSESLQYLLENEKGRWFIMRLFDRCHMMSSTYPDTDHTDRMLIAEGERRAALTVKNNIMQLGDDAVLQFQTAEREYAAWQKRMQDMMESQEGEDKHVGF